jgi:hypothetical protein
MGIGLENIGILNWQQNARYLQALRQLMAVAPPLFPAAWSICHGYRETNNDL